MQRNEQNSVVVQDFGNCAITIREFQGKFFIISIRWTGGKTDAIHI